jgi:hypothetical protein
MKHISHPVIRKTARKLKVGNDYTIGGERVKIVGRKARRFYAVRVNPSRRSGLHIAMNRASGGRVQVLYYSGSGTNFVPKRADALSYASTQAVSRAIIDLVTHHPQLRGKLYLVAGSQVRRSARRNPHKAGTANKHNVRELLIFAKQDGDLYRMQGSQIRKNLTRKFKKGKYSSAQAAKLWTYLADNAAKKYTFEFDHHGGARSWQLVKGFGAFSAADRRMVGRLLEKAYHAEMKLGNFDG